VVWFRELMKRSSLPMRGKLGQGWRGGLRISGRERDLNESKRAAVWRGASLGGKEGIATEKHHEKTRPRRGKTGHKISGEERKSPCREVFGGKACLNECSGETASTEEKGAAEKGWKKSVWHVKRTLQPGRSEMCFKGGLLKVRRRLFPVEGVQVPLGLYGAPGVPLNGVAGLMKKAGKGHGVRRGGRAFGGGGKARLLKKLIGKLKGKAYNSRRGPPSGKPHRKKRGRGKVLKGTSCGGSVGRARPAPKTNQGVPEKKT